MQVTIKANGSPDEVRTSVANNIREARAAAGEGSWPALRAIRDGLAIALDGSEPNERVGVDVSITITRDAPRAEGGAPALSAAPSEPAPVPGAGSPVAGPPIVERRGSGKRSDR